MLPEMAKAMSEHAVFEMYSGYIYLQASLAMEKENYKAIQNGFLITIKRNLLTLRTL